MGEGRRGERIEGRGDRQERERGGEVDEGEKEKGEKEEETEEEEEGHTEVDVKALGLRSRQ